MCNKNGSKNDFHRQTCIQIIATVYNVTRTAAELVQKKSEIRKLQNDTLTANYYSIYNCDLQHVNALVYISSTTSITVTAIH